MTFAAKGSPPGHGGDPLLELSSLGGVDLQANIPNQAQAQEENCASEITCASMRTLELRDGLVREILRASAIGMQAQAALLDGDDEAALGHLRRHWIVMRANVTPMASELGSLLKESP
jgi:hypothetical protein